MLAQLHRYVNTRNTLTWNTGMPWHAVPACHGIPTTKIRWPSKGRQSTYCPEWTIRPLNSLSPLNLGVHWRSKKPLHSMTASKIWVVGSGNLWVCDWWVWVIGVDFCVVMCGVWWVLCGVWYVVCGGCVWWVMCGDVWCVVGASCIYSILVKFVLCKTFLASI